MIDRVFADEFAADWIGAWNEDDAERLFRHFADDFQAWAPALALVTGETEYILRGRSAVIEAWAHARDRLMGVNFALSTTLAGAASVTVYYRGIKGRLAAESFNFDPGRKVLWAVTMLGEPLAVWPFLRFATVTPLIRDAQEFRATSA